MQWTRMTHLTAGCVVIGAFFFGCAVVPPATPVDRVAERIELPSGIQVDRATREVRVPAFVATRTGYLEQIACARGTRDHESLVWINVPASAVHAALLLAGYESGAPGTWSFEQGNGRQILRRAAPTGSALSIAVAMTDEDGREVVAPIERWIVGIPGEVDFPPSRFIFGGSEFVALPQPDGGPFVETYIADMTGSIVGFVTFGDEVIGLESIIADQLDIDSAQWMARGERMPAVGTEVQLVITPARARDVQPQVQSQ